MILKLFIFCENTDYLPLLYNNHTVWLECDENGKIDQHCDKSMKLGTSEVHEERNQMQYGD